MKNINVHSIFLSKYTVLTRKFQYCSKIPEILIYGEIYDTIAKRAMHEPNTTDINTYYWSLFYLTNTLVISD
jgi:hypothetical protein